MTIKEFFNGLIENPALVLKNIALAFNHDSDKGFSLKKMTFAYFVGIIITGLYAAYVWFRLKAGHFEEFVWVLPMTLTWAGYLINLNAKQESELLKAGNGLTANTAATPQ